MSYRQEFAKLLGHQFASHVGAADRSICRRIAERDIPNDGDLKMLISIITQALVQEEEARLIALSTDEAWDARVDELIASKTVQELQKMAGNEDYREEMRDGRRLSGPAVHNEGRRDHYETTARYARAALTELGIAK